MHEGERSQDFGFQWDNWRVKDVIGRGSFSTVYTVVKEEFGATYEAALKHISIPKSEEEYRESFNVSFTSEEQARVYYRSGVQRLQTEIDLMFRLQGHSHIVNYQAHKITEKKNIPGYDVYIRMEKLKTLSRIIREKGDLSQEEVLKVGLDICDALKAVHVENVLHRDIKLENVFYGKGEYKLGDFGVSRTLSQMDKVTTAGTPHYMAPEIYHHMETDHTADIYSLGIMLYRLLNGNRVPFLPADRAITPTWEQDQEAFSRRMKGEAFPAIDGVREDLMQVVLKACAFQPAERYQSAGEMAAALEGCREPRKTQQATAGGWDTGWFAFSPSSEQKLDENIDPNATVIAPVQDVPEQNASADEPAQTVTEREKQTVTPQPRSEQVALGEKVIVEEQRKPKSPKKSEKPKKTTIQFCAIFAVVVQLFNEVGAAIVKGLKATAATCVGLFAAIGGLFKRKPKAQAPVQPEQPGKPSAIQQQSAGNNNWNPVDDPWGLGGSSTDVADHPGESRQAAIGGEFDTRAVSGGNGWDPFGPNVSTRRRFSLSPELFKLGAIAAAVIAVVALAIVLIGSVGRTETLELNYAITKEGYVKLSWEDLSNAECYEVYGGEAGENASVDWQLLAECDRSHNYHISNKFPQAEQSAFQVKAILKNGNELITNIVYVTKQERNIK